MKFFKAVFVALFFTAGIISCQKDGQPENGALINPITKADTSDNSGNFFAAKGTLNITVDDSTYAFDAAKDSIAFINVNIDSNKYFGLTAINKAHTISFGISSPGFAGPGLDNMIAGGQLLFNVDGKHIKQFALSNSVGNNLSNAIHLDQYMQDSVLTKGTFTTLMSKKDDDGNDQVVSGSFYLLRK
ncbi:hypothetical protein ACFS5N_00215 [Mucilaginibacter ximonensis]|uniref:CHRD domain-containing protein n=1 Tax=Mucilaginibacter ximonensis TaxID=538021 RepID=A0ABW5Y692_9SPHI